MRKDYVWDGSGDPDPEVQRLESLLNPLRHDGRLLDLPATVPQTTESRLPWWRTDGLRFALAGLVLLMIGAGTWRVLQHPVPEPLAGWSVSRVEGAPTVGTQQISVSGRLGLGQWLETNSNSRAIINVASVGQVQVDPDTRIGLVRTAQNNQRMALSRGTIHAMIWAPPGEFVVDTPSATAVDLGCAYTLHVDDSGVGLVRVTFGWVAFKVQGREAFIPAGAVCATRPGIGPGLPCYEDASPEFKKALAALDEGNVSPEARNAALRTVLLEARTRDALTLWHLLSRSEGPDRSQVYARLSALVPPPAGITEEGVLRGDKSMMDQWWNALGLGTTSWWRIWERDWQQ